MQIDGWMIGTAITLCGYAGGFLWHAAYLRGVYGTKIEAHDKKLDSLERSVVYRDTCEAHREGTEARVSRIERAMNGKLGDVG